MFFLFPSGHSQGLDMFVFGGCTFSAGILDALHHVTFGHELLHEVQFWVEVKQLSERFLPCNLLKSLVYTTNIYQPKMHFNIQYINLSRKQASLRRGRPFSCHPIFRMIAASFPTPAVAFSVASAVDRVDASNYFQKASSKIFWP